MLEPQFIEKFRQLPYSGQVLVQPGDWVRPEQTVARVDYLPGAMRKVEIARQLRISGNRIKECLVPEPGDQIQSGEELAISSSFGERRAVHSPYGGYLGLVSRTLGHVYVREPVPVGANKAVQLPAAETISVSPTRLRDHLRVYRGAMVIPGQVLAAKMTGIETALVQSPIYGQVTDISKGIITVEPVHASTELRAHLAGRVTQVVPGQGAYIRAFAHVIEGKYGVGGESCGELLVVDCQEDDLPPSGVMPDWRGKTVAVRKSASLAAIEQSAAFGVKALILGHLHLNTLLGYANNTKAIGSTGDDDLPMPVILLTGFLAIPTPDAVWNTLQRLQGRSASVNGTTHIRAGVIRPEIVICEEQWPSSTQTTSTQTRLEEGVLVRLLRGKMIGKHGRVLALPEERQQLITGSLVRVAMVRIEEEIFQIPIANLELLPNEE